MTEEELKKAIEYGIADALPKLMRQWEEVYTKSLLDTIVNKNQMPEQLWIAILKFLDQNGYDVRKKDEKK